jgi:hypothetical protein
MEKKGTVAKIVAAALATSIGAFVAFLAYMGLFTSPTVTEQVYPGGTIIYALHRGPYDEIGKSWESFERAWKSAGLKTCQSLAIYLDAPDTPPQDLRSVLGCLLPNNESVEDYSDFPTFKIPAMRSLYATFPYRNMLSFMLGPVRVYPAMSARLEDLETTPSIAIEVYGDPESIETLEFYMPLEEPLSTFDPLKQAFEE